MVLMLVGTLLGASTVLATGTVIGYEISSHTRTADFPNSIPGKHTDVSYQDAFRHHKIQLPAGVSGLEYLARSNLDGYPMYADFVIPCTEKTGFVQSNHLTEVEEGALANAALGAFVTERGWIVGSTRNHWYEQPVGPAPTLQVLIDDSSPCRVYLNAIDYY